MDSKTQSKVLERRRLKAGRLLLKGVAQIDVARRFGVAKSTVSGWHAKLERGGLDALRATGLRGRPAALDEADRKGLGKLLLKGPRAAGFTTDVWTLRRVRALVKREIRVVLSESQIWRVLRGMGFSPQKPAKRALQRDENKAREWQTQRWPALKKRFIAEFRGRRRGF